MAASLRIYKIDEKYIRFLYSRDKKVQYNKGSRRPYIGVVMNVGKYKYFVPMESPKPNHKNMKPGKHIMLIGNGTMGLLGFNNMVPVPEEALIPFDINAVEDEKYKGLLLRQASACNKAKAEIMRRASDTYFDVVNKKNEFLQRISCDFEKLERACKAYDPNR